jgi:anti-sigma regulatory factor (Ser/Thr protein kinase)
MAQFSKTLDSQLSEIAGLAEAMELWGEDEDVPMPTLMQVNLMMDELITNIVMHGYDNQPGKRLEVKAQIKKAHGKRKLEVVLTDFAKPFNLLEHSAPNTEAALEDREIGGLGIHFVRKLADRVDYARTELSNIVTIVKSLPE